MLVGIDAGNGGERGRVACDFDSGIAGEEGNNLKVGSP